ncbi:MAG: hypothetical protein KDD69_14060 [Bdellovibrionales bacterium]|nr:hypothetical protein [Bdellovibrionales bacterium]
MKQTPPNCMELTALAQVVNEQQGVDVILAEAARWIDWESALTLQLKDVYIHRVDPTSRLPLFVALSKDADPDPIPYDPEMKFILRLP